MHLGADTLPGFASTRVLDMYDGSNSKENMSPNVIAELVDALCVQACWMRLPSGPSSRAYTPTVSAGRPVCSPRAHVRISRGLAREGDG